MSTEQMEDTNKLWYEIVEDLRDVNRKQETVKSKIRKLAETMKKQYLATGEQDKIKRIARELVIKAEQAGLNSSSYIYDSLDEEYKTSYSSLTNLDHLSVSEQPNVTVESKMEFSKITDALSNMRQPDMSKLTREQLQSIRDRLFDVSEEYDKKFQKHNIALITDAVDPSPVFTGVDIEKPQTSLDKLEEEINTKPEYDASMPVQDAVVAVDRQAFKLAMEYMRELEIWIYRQSKEFPSKTVDQAIRYRDMWISELQIIRQVNDSNNNKTIEDWVKMIRDLGRHSPAYASRAARTTVKDPNTGREMIDPRTLKPVYYKPNKAFINHVATKYATIIEQLIHSSNLRLEMHLRYVELERDVRDWKKYNVKKKKNADPGSQT